MRGTIRNLFSLFVLILLLGTVGPGYAQTPVGPFDFGTGHKVEGVFLEQYNSVPNPEQVYGLPITGQFQGMSANGITTVQYFQKARFDLVKNADGEDTIVVAELGELMYPGPGPLAPVPSDGPTCRQFEETSKSVCYAFLQFYDRNNGAVNFGLPISDLEIREGRYVQYFEKVRMEWQPELQADSHVVLTDLGKRYFDLVVGDPRLLWPDSEIPGTARNPVAHAFVSRPLVTAHSQQTVYIVVYDKYGVPVDNAQVWVYIQTPDGTRSPYRAMDTNRDGISTFTYAVGDWLPRQIIELEVEIEAAGETADTSTWFRIWY